MSDWQVSAHACTHKTWGVCRGYRGPVHRAGLNEAAAAGILTLAGWPYHSRAPPLTCTMQLRWLLGQACASQLQLLSMLAGAQQ